VEYKLRDSSDDRKAFFDDVPVSFKNSIKAHFPSSSLGVEREMVFNIEKDIVDVIVRDMMFEPSDDIIDSDPEDDMDEPPAFSSDAERNVALHRRAQQSVLAKEQALSLFKRVDGDDNADMLIVLRFRSRRQRYFSWRYDMSHVVLPFEWQPTY
jgi:hypothetical protein